MLRFGLRVEPNASRVVARAKEYRSRHRLSSRVRWLESSRDVLEVDIALEHLLVDKVDRDGDVLDPLGDRTRSDDINARLAVLIDSDGLASARHVEEASNVKEIECALCPSEGQLDFGIGGADQDAALLFNLPVYGNTTQCDKDT